MIVVKFGGHAMTDEGGSFAQAMASAIAAGESVVVVHGGGPQINQALTQAGVSSDFIGGFRVTSPEVLSVVEEVLAGQIGPAIASHLMDHGFASAPLSGKADNILVARKLETLVDGQPVDLGLVGKVVSVNVAPIENVLSQQQIPVISPIALSEDGKYGFNVNADLAAAAIAAALNATQLIVMTDVAGIYRNWPDTSTLITEISASQLREIKSTFSEGMAPKVQACLDAIDHGAQAVRIIDGTDPEAFALALAGQGGTLVHK